MFRVMLVLAGLGVIAMGVWQMTKGMREINGGQSPAPYAANDGGGASGLGVDQASMAAQTAGRQFLAMAASASQPGAEAPRQSDPAAGPLLDAVFDTRPLQSAPAPDFEHIDPVLKWLGTVTQVGQTYVLAGTGVTDASQAGADPRVGQQVERNVVQYAPEIGRYADAEMVLLTTELASVSGELERNPALAQTPNGADGLAKIRGGVTTAVGGELNVLVTPGLTDDWRRARLAPLAAIAPRAAHILDPGQKAQLSGLARQVAGMQTDPDVRAGLESFASAVGAPG